MKTTIYAVLHNGRTGKDEKKTEICRAILYDDNRISADKYRRIWGQIHKLPRAGKGSYYFVETAEGLRVAPHSPAACYIAFK